MMKAIKKGRKSVSFSAFRASYFYLIVQYIQRNFQDMMVLHF